MYIRIFVLTVFLLFLTGKTSGQPNVFRQLDSLKLLALKQNPDSNSLKALNEINLYFFYRGQYDSALKYSLISLPIAKTLNDNIKLSKMYYATGMNYTLLSKYDSSHQYLEKAYSIAEKETDTILILSTLNGFAVLYNYQSYIEKSTEYLLKQVLLLEQSDNPALKKFKVQAYGNIGHNLIEEKQYQKGIDYILQALRISKYPSEERFRITLHLDVFFAYLNLKDLPKSKIYLDSATYYNQKLENIETSMLVLNNTGLYFKAIEDYKEAATNFLKAKNICDSTNNDYMRSEICSNLGAVYLRLKNYKLAEAFANEANEVAHAIHKFDVIAESYFTLQETAKANGNYSKALDFAALFKNYSDSVSNEKTQKEILTLEGKFESEKKEKEIASLKLSNTQKALNVTRKTRLLGIVGIAAAALLIVLGLLNRQNKQKRMIAEKDQVLKDEQIKFLERQQQVVSLQSMVNGQETERTRIAKDLHDGLGGLFSTIKMNFSSLQHENAALKTNPLFSKSYEMVDTASEEVRRIAHNMMPEVLIKLGLVQATKELCNSISAGKLLQASLQSYGMEKRLNASTEIMLFRIIQELLNNIIKHAYASEAIIQFNREGNRLSVTVEDNGRGFNLQETDGNKHAGLESVQSRINYLNGNLSIESQKEIGTTIMMDFLINE